MIYGIIITSIILQIIAATMAIRLIWVTKKQYYWAILALAISLQVVRRLTSFFGLMNGTIKGDSILDSEIIALIISALEAVAIMGMTPIFNNMKEGIDSREIIIGEMERKNQLYLDTVGAIVTVINKDGIVEMINKTGCNLLGYEKDEIIGKNWFDAFVPDEEKESLKETLDKCIRGEISSTFQRENCIIGKNGGKRVILWDNAVLTDEKGDVTSILATGKDITQRKRAEEEIELYFNADVNLMCVSGVDGYFKRINTAWCKVLGWTIEELMSKPYIEFVHPNDREETLAVANRFMQNTEIFVHINRYICKDGSYKWIEWNARKVEGEDVFVASARNITIRKELEKINLELEKSKQMEILKAEFFANISHELRTPLNIIYSAVQVREKDIEDDIKEESEEEFNKRSKYIKIIKQNAFRLMKLVNNIVDLTKIDLGYFNIQMQNSNIIHIIEEITLSTSEYVEAKGIFLQFDTDLEERIIACDPDKIERILLNLLSNAVKFTEAGGNIWINITNDEDKVTISVRDSGIGIEKEKCNLIFEKFMQVDKSLTRRCEGSGMGLSIAKLLIEMQGGSIYVNSEIGKGSEFVLELPAVLCDAKPCVKPEIEAKNSRIQKTNIEFSDIYTLNE